MTFWGVVVALGAGGGRQGGCVGGKQTRGSVVAAEGRRLRSRLWRNLCVVGGLRPLRARSQPRVARQRLQVLVVLVLGVLVVGFGGWPLLGG